MALIVDQVKAHGKFNLRTTPLDKLPVTLNIFPAPISKKSDFEYIADTVEPASHRITFKEEAVLESLNIDGDFDYYTVLIMGDSQVDYILNEDGLIPQPKGRMNVFKKIIPAGYQVVINFRGSSKNAEIKFNEYIVDFEDKIKEYGCDACDKLKGMKSITDVDVYKYTNRIGEEKAVITFNSRDGETVDLPNIDGHLYNLVLSASEKPVVPNEIQYLDQDHPVLLLTPEKTTVTVKKCASEQPQPQPQPQLPSQQPEAPDSSQHKPQLPQPQHHIQQLPPQLLIVLQNLSMIYLFQLLV
jgi:hypothetical protein